MWGTANAYESFSDYSSASLQGRIKGSTSCRNVQDDNIVLSAPEATAIEKLFPMAIVIIHQEYDFNKHINL